MRKSPNVPDDPQTTMTPVQAHTGDVEKVAKLAERYGLTLDEFIGQKPWFKSRGFNAYRWADHKPFNECVEQLATVMERHEGRKRARTADEAGRFRDGIKALILDLYVAHLSDPELQVGINLNANSFSSGARRYRNERLTYKQFKAAYEGLEALSYIVTDKKGYFDRTRKTGKNTKVRATDTMMALLIEKAELYRPRNTNAASNSTTPATALNMSR